MAVGLDPLEIVNEYVENANPQIRRNAATALAAIGSQESISRLVERALTDESEQVREHIQHQIREMPHEQAGLFSIALGDQLRNLKTRPKAYALFAWLRGHGVALLPPKERLWTRLDLAWGARATFYPKGFWKLVFRGLRPGMFGATVACAGFYFYLNLLAAVSPELLGLDGDILVALVWAWLLSLPFAALGGWLVTPVGFHLYWGPGVLVESLKAGLPFVVPVFLAASLVAEEEPAAAAATLLILAMAALARLGSLAVTGISQRPRTQWVFSTLGGAALAGLAISWGALLVQPNVLDAPYTIHEAVSGMWFFGVPVSVALAFVYATVDGQFRTPPVDVPVRRARSLLLWVLVVLVVLPLVVALFPRQGNGSVEPQVAFEAEPGKPVTNQWKAAVPWSQGITVQFPQDVQVSIGRVDGYEYEGPDDFIVSVATPTGRVIDQSFGSLLGRIDEPGRYRVRIERRRSFLSQLDVDEVYPLLIVRNLAFVERESRERGRVEVTIILNEGSEGPSPEQPSPKQEEVRPPLD